MTKVLSDKDEYLLGLKSKLEKANKGFSSEADDVDRSLLNQLFVAAGGFIALSSALLVTKETLHTFTLSGHARYVVLAVVLLSLASIFCGVTQLVMDARYLRKRKAINADIIERISENKIKSPKYLKRLLAKQHKAGERSGSWWMWTQLGCLIVSGIGLIATAIYLLFIAKINF